MYACITHQLQLPSHPPQVYASLTYYEKWAAAITSILISRATISRADVEAAMGLTPATSDVLFVAGDAVGDEACCTLFEACHTSHVTRHT